MSEAKKYGPRKKYSPEFKDQALARVARDGVPKAAKDLGIPDAMLYSWRAKAQQGGTPLEKMQRVFSNNILLLVIDLIGLQN